jgi:hypothetical protein
MLRMEELRRIAAGIDERVQQLATERVAGPELLYRMAPHLAELQRIWVGAEDRQLAALCREYPAFYRYAKLMEEAAETERAKTGTRHQDLPQLSGALRDQLAAVMTEAGALERRYQAAIAAKDRNIGELIALHRNWQAKREELLRDLAASQPKAADFLRSALGQIGDRIAGLEKQAGG